MRIPCALGAAALIVSAIALSACGSSSTPEPNVARASAPATGFPPSKGKTIARLRQGLEAGPMLAPTVSELTVGEDRFGFGLFDTSHKQLKGVPVAIYVERSGTSDVTGPFVAKQQSLAVESRFQSATVKSDPDSASSMYVTDVAFPAPGTYAVQGIGKIRGRLVASDPIPVLVTRNDPVPAVGQLAPKVHTPTLASVHGNVAAIDTRQPPDSMHATDLYDVLGKKPVVLLFATPALCRSRVCGPVTDLAEEVKSQHRDVAFIHNEIYVDNEIKPGCLEGSRPQSQCVRPQVIAYHLPSEPWLFAIDKKGRIAARFDGAFSKQELEVAVDKARGR